MRHLFCIVLLSVSVGCQQKEIGKYSLGPGPGQWEHPITVEEGKLDNGALACAIQQLSADGTHNDTVKAFANIATTKNSTVVIVGHGSPGSLCTANGDVCTASINYKNEQEWSQLLTDIKNNQHIKQIRLLGCGVGRLSVGDDLLKALAKDTNRTILAPTSVVFCTANGVELDQGGTWKQEPAPVGEPNVAYTDSPFISEHIDLGPTAKPRFISWNNIQIVDFSVLRSIEGTEFEILDGKEADRLARQIIFDKQFLPPGQPLARLTGRLVLQLNSPIPIRRVFLIYGDMIVRNDDNSTEFYRVSADFTEALVNRRQ